MAKERQAPSGEDLVKDTERWKAWRGLELSQEGFGDLTF